ncbi:MAG TPA: hypothetical protein VK968_11360, partial [Roseimicrobium sp.]|nr:hypothetical protein [Roseimicrobium sp.]
MNSREVTDSPEAIAEDRRRIRRKAMWLLFWASPVLFVILFYLVENWRGARAWKKCQEEMAAKGEKLDYASFVPPKIPVEQNFAAAPVFQMVFDQTNDTWSGSVPKPSVY